VIHEPTKAEVFFYTRSRDMRRST